MFAGEHLAGPAVAGLHLVGDQENPVLVAELAQARHKGSRRHDVAALAQHRLDDEGGDVLGRDTRVEHLRDEIKDVVQRRLVARPRGIPVRVRIGHVVDAGEKRLVALAVVALGRGE